MLKSQPPHSAGQTAQLHLGMAPPTLPSVSTQMRGSYPSPGPGPQLPPIQFSHAPLKKS